MSAFPTYAFLLIAAAAFATLTLSLFIWWFLRSCLRRVPPKYHSYQMKPWHFALMFLFGPFWIFLMNALYLPGMVRTFRLYFIDHPTDGTGDCGKNLSELIRFWHIALVLMFRLPPNEYMVIIYAGVGTAYFVLLYMLLSKFNRYKQMLPPMEDAP